MIDWYSTRHFHNTRLQKERKTTNTCGWKRTYAATHSPADDLVDDPASPQWRWHLSPVSWPLPPDSCRPWPGRTCDCDTSGAPWARQTSAYSARASAIWRSRQYLRSMFIRIAMHTYTHTKPRRSIRAERNTLIFCTCIRVSANFYMSNMPQ